MKFQRSLETKSDLFSIRIEPSTTPIEEGFQFDGEIYIESQNEDPIIIEGKEGLEVSKKTFNSFNENIEVSYFGKSPDDWMEFHLEGFSGDEFGEISFPPISLLNSAWILVEHDSQQIPDAIYRVFDQEDEATLLFDFIHTIAPVISYEYFKKLLEELSDSSPSFRFRLGNQLEDLLRDMTAQVSLGQFFPISSYSELESRASDFESFTAFERLEREINIKQSVRYALSKLQDDGKTYQLINIVDKLSVDKNVPELLIPPQQAGLLAYRFKQGDQAGAKSVIQNCISIDEKVTSTYDNLKDEAFKKDSIKQRQQSWRKAVVAAVQQNNEFEFPAGQYLYWTARLWETNDSGRYDEFSNISKILYDASYDIFDSQDYHLAQYVNYNRCFSAGIRLKSNDNYEQAVEKFKKAVAIACDRDDRWNRTLYPLFLSALNLKWQTEIHARRENEGIESAIEKKEEQISTVQSLEVPDEYSSELSNKLYSLRAELHKLKTDQHLMRNEFDLALETAGQTIKNYAKNDDDESKRWAITKRKQIQAILAETEGEFEQAAITHSEIAESGNTKQSTRDWHNFRSKICEAKRLALSKEYSKAKKELTDHGENHLKKESKDLGILLDAAIAYQNGEQTRVRTALNKLSSTNESSIDSRPLSVSYNYEAAIAVLSAVQRLSHASVDSEVLEMLVEVALRDSFSDIQSDNIASSVGLDNVDLKNRWKTEIPSPVARRIARLQLDEEMPAADYMGRSSRVLGTLELYLAAFAEYYGFHYWGEGWKEELTSGEGNKKLSLGDLTRLFDRNITENLESSSQVKELLNTDLLGRSSITELRNEITHEHIDSLSREEYISIRDRVISLIRQTAKETPIIGKVQDAFPKGDFYTVQLYWWRPERQTIVNTSRELETESHYYFPREQIIESDEIRVVEIDEKNIVPVKTDRVIRNISEMG